MQQDKAYRNESIHYSTKSKAKPTTKRPCLKCGKPFNSEGIHNRICLICKQGADWKFGDGGVTTSGPVPTRKGRSE